MPKVLIVEDDLLIADCTEEFLARSGYEVCGIARTVDEAVDLGRRHQPDLILLDLRLADGGFGTQVAAALTALGRIGVLYATGNISQFALDMTDGDACIVKPYSSSDLVRSLEIVTEVVATGTASPPFPRGFRMLPRPLSADPALRASADRG
jgi:DNA-binding response OmpR family regulator